MYKIQNNIFYKSQNNTNNKNEKIFELNENSKLNLMIVDNFYEDPMLVREFALSQNFDITGSFPGKRTKPFASTDLKNAIQECIKEFGEIYNFYLPEWEECDCYSGSFFMNTVNSEMPWIHNDIHNIFDDECYSAIIYLTPDAPLISGISLLEPKPSKYYSHDEREFDKTKYLEIDKLGNKFNRLILFNAIKLHYPNNYFGIDNEEGRLTQVCWFNISPKIHDKEMNNTEINETISKSIYPCNLNKNKEINIIIIEDFYKNPLELRNFALLQSYNRVGNYPGFRSKSFAQVNILKLLQRLLKKKIELISNNSDSHSGSFQYTTSNNRSWIHKDSYINDGDSIDYGGIIYLTPDAPHTAGTTLYNFYDKNAGQKILDMYSQDMTKWEEIDIIGNKFNRFVLFNSNIHHMSRDYFGLDINNGRLFQVFFNL